MQLRVAEQPWIVLVEDSEPLERELVGALQRALPGIEVRCTPDADVALQLVNDSRSRILITEANSRSVDGLTLAACVRMRRSSLPLIFLSDDYAGSRSRIASFGASHLIEKPPQVQQLVDLVARILDAPPGFRGELRSHDLIELVQLVAMTMPNGALHLSTPEGQGTMWFDEGMIVHALTQDEDGVAAFQRMLTWTGGDFGVEANGLAPARSITLTTTQLLLEGTRLLDEEGMQARHEKSGALPVFRSAAEHFERGLDAVRHKRYGDALPEWERAVSIDPGNRAYQHNLRRLCDLLSLQCEPKTKGSRE
jgi:hypothetical protein